MMMDGACEKLEIKFTVHEECVRKGGLQKIVLECRLALCASHHSLVNAVKEVYSETLNFV
jgi:hypothetical protein